MVVGQVETISGAGPRHWCVRRKGGRAVERAGLDERGASGNKTNAALLTYARPKTFAL